MIFFPAHLRRRPRLLEKIKTKFTELNKYTEEREVTHRQAQLNAPGTLHHVVIRGIERGRIVDDDQDRKNFVS